VIAFAENKGVPVVCCGERMSELLPNTVDASQEKHVPVAVIRGNTVEVTVGAVEHPMLKEHSILWIALETAEGNQRKLLTVGGAPKAEFALTASDHPKVVYEYCNLHGLWKKEL
jgi:superoxide reductase